MRVVINQSNYIPWKGYFDLIHDADLMIFLDNVQFTPRDWRSRNRIKTAQGTQWLTVPVGNDRNRLICDVPMPEHEWNINHWKALQNSYGRTPYFQDFKNFFEDIYKSMKWKTLSEFNQFVTKTIAKEFLGIKTTFLDARQFDVHSSKQELILDLVKQSGATTYISGPTAKAYLDPNRFDELGVKLIWKDYSGYPTYLQPHGEFDHAVTILDTLFCTGPATSQFIWGWRDTGRAAEASL